HGEGLPRTDARGLAGTRGLILDQPGFEPIPIRALDAERVAEILGKIVGAQQIEANTAGRDCFGLRLRTDIDTAAPDETGKAECGYFAEKITTIKPGIIWQ